MNIVRVQGDVLNAIERRSLRSINDAMAGVFQHQDTESEPRNHDCDDSVESSNSNSSTQSNCRQKLLMLLIRKVRDVRWRKCDQARDVNTTRPRDIALLLNLP
jgi:hypothetical protein